MGERYADLFYQASLAAVDSRHNITKVLNKALAIDRASALENAAPPADAATAGGGDGASAAMISALSRWRSDLHRDFIACLGGVPWQCPLNIRRGEQKKLTAVALNEVEYKGYAGARGYTRERIVFEAESGLLTPAYLLTPDGAGAATPTVIALAGHGFGVADIVGLRPDGAEQQPGESGYHKSFAVALAQRGFVVLAPELLGFGELRLARDVKPDNPGASSCDAISTMLFMIGRTMAGVRVNQARRCVDVLAELGYRQAPVAMGISGGGLVCSYFAAVDDRVRACCVSGFANTYRGCVLAMHHCVDNYQPGLLLAADMPDILSMIAPRPMIWESGEHDPIFPIANVLEAEAIVRRVYEALGKGDNFEVDRFPDVHTIHGVRSYDFLWKHAN